MHRFNVIHRRNRLASDGFTIIELLIATGIFSVILLLMAFSLLQIGRIYYKGITSSRTQETARSITDNVAQAIQFSGGPVNDSTVNSFGSEGELCAGDKLYTYILGTQLNSSNHALIQDSSPSPVCPPSASLPPMKIISPSQRELLSPNMTLLNLIVHNTSGNLYCIDVQVAYGDPADTSLMMKASVVSRCGQPVQLYGCRSGFGTQFCAVSELTTEALKRL